MLTHAIDLVVAAILFLAGLVMTVIGVIDAIYQPHRPFSVGGRSEQVPAFNVTFAVN